MLRRLSFSLKKVGVAPVPFPPAPDPVLGSRLSFLASLGKKEFFLASLGKKEFFLWAPSLGKKEFFFCGRPLLAKRSFFCGRPLISDSKGVPSPPSKKDGGLFTLRSTGATGKGGKEEK